VLSVKSRVHHTVFPVPDFVLDLDTIYHWRARFVDDRGAASEWSESSSFTTPSLNDTDLNGNGVPDDQEVHDLGLDLDEDGTSDATQSNMKCVNTLVGDYQVGVKCAETAHSVESIQSIDPDAIPDISAKPDELPFGLVSFKLKVARDSTEVTVYLSEPAPSGARWYKYDPTKGWYEYPFATFSADRTRVTLYLEDGNVDAGDIDGVKNGIIVDPGGVGVMSTPSQESSSGGGGCFIATAAYGSRMAKEVEILRNFRDDYLLTSAFGRQIISFYYKNGKPVATYIESHPWLKGPVRIALYPIVGVVWLIASTGTISKVLMLVLAMTCCLIAVRKTAAKMEK
jgi:hypothetical protein